MLCIIPNINIHTRTRNEQTTKDRQTLSQQIIMRAQSY